MLVYRQTETTRAVGQENAQNINFPKSTVPYVKGKRK